MTQRVADSSLVPGDHGTTYGGNPFVGAAVSTVFDLFEKEKIVDHVNEIAPYMEEKLDGLKEKYSFITDAAGYGSDAGPGDGNSRGSGGIESSGAGADGNYCRFQCGASGAAPCD